MKPQVKWLVLIYVSISIQSNPTLFFSSIPLSFSLNDGKPPNYTHFPSNLFNFQKWNWFKTKTRRTPSARTAHCKYWLVCTAVVVVSFDFDWCVPKTVELKRTLIDVKFVNLQYNMLGQLSHWPSVWCSKYYLLMDLGHSKLFIFIFF